MLLTAECCEQARGANFSLFKGVEMSFWICERGGTPVGPFDRAQIKALMSARQISSAALVCRVGQAAWFGIADLERWSDDHECLLPGSQVPTLAPLGGRLVLRHDLGTASVIALSVITLGIYGLVWFYQSAMAYREIAGRSSSTPELFWWYVGTYVLTVILVFFPLAGLIPIVAGVVVGAFLLRQVLSDRDAAMRLLGIRPDVHSVGSHMCLWILGEVLSWVLLGLVPTLIQAIWFVSDHRKVVAAAHSVRPDLAGKVE